MDRPHILNGGGALFPTAHDTGLVMLQVAMGGEVISSSVVFEYKARDLPALPSSQHDWLSLDGKWTDLRELTGEKERHTECVPCVSIERVCRVWAYRVQLCVEMVNSEANYTLGPSKQYARSCHNISFPF